MVLLNCHGLFISVQGSYKDEIIHHEYAIRGFIGRNQEASGITIIVTTSAEYNVYVKNLANKDYQMNQIESSAEIFLMALQALSKAERKAVVNRLLEDPKVREDILDLTLIRQRQGEPSWPFREYLAERKK